MEVVPLTRHLCDRLSRSADTALNGDGTCSERTMATSCFMSENCSLGLAAMDLSSLLQHSLAYAIEDRGEFVGCVSAMVGKRGIPSAHFPEQCAACGPKSLCIYNLCISDAYRGQGYGRRLIDEVMRENAPETYMLIAKTQHKETPIVSAFQSRVTRLLSTYSHFGFQVVSECPRAVLLVHAPSR
tara:strand:- start:1737 stop:2291 length:555 start_codon:yes stop_codon:yes gene_type:complete